MFVVYSLMLPDALVDVLKDYILVLVKKVFFMYARRIRKTAGS